MTKSQGTFNTFRVSMDGGTFAEVTGGPCPKCQTPMKAHFAPGKDSVEITCANCGVKVVKNRADWPQIPQG